MSNNPTRLITCELTTRRPWHVFKMDIRFGGKLISSINWLIIRQLTSGTPKGRWGRNHVQEPCPLLIACLNNHGLLYMIIFYYSLNFVLIPRMQMLVSLIPNASVHFAQIQYDCLSFSILSQHANSWKVFKRIENLPEHFTDLLLSLYQFSQEDRILIYCQPFTNSWYSKPCSLIAGNESS